MSVSIEQAMNDPKLLGAALGDPAPWAAWRAILKAAFGISLDSSEADTFAKVAGGRSAPTSRVSELWATAGRRGGKSRMAALAASYIAAFGDHAGKLAPGETGHVIVLAASKSQARAVHDYVAGFFESSPILAQMLDDINSEEIKLKGNISISVHTNSFRTVRGRTLLAAIFDETAFWRDETSASPDVEVYRAVLPALATTGGMLIGISSPYRRIGLMYTKHRDFYGKDDPDTLVIQAATSVLNPTIDEKVIERARRDDPEAARAEWDAEFRTDLSSLLDDATIDAAIVHGRPLDLPPDPDVKQYRAFLDMSGGRSDASVICVGHKGPDGQFIADAIRARKAPHDPAEVLKEFVALAREYRCTELTGDNYSGSWLSGAVQKLGITYHRSKLNKSQLYLESVPVWMQEKVEIPNHAQLIRELRLLERRTSRSGKDSVDHPQGAGQHDDHANALVGCIHIVMKPQKQSFALAAPSFCVGGMWSSSPISHADHDPASFGATIAR